MRTIQLLSSLSKQELKLIENQVMAGKRKSLIPLFKELKRNVQKGTEPTGPDLYKKAFGTAYEKNKDYLLRNELRLLNDIIYDYLVEHCLKENLAKNKGLFNRWLAQSLFDRQINIFHEDINGFINQAIKYLQTDEASAMFALRSHWESSHPIGDRKNAVEHVKQWKQQEKRRFLHRLRRIEFSEHFFEKFAKVADNTYPRHDTDDWSKPGEVNIEFSEIEKSDWYARYLNLQIRYTQSKGEAQRNYLLEIIKELSSEPAQLVSSTYENRVKAVMALAYNYSGSKQYTEADKYMKEAISLSKKKRLFISAPFILNYMINSLMIKQPNQAIDTYTEYKAQLQENANRSLGLVITAYAYLFMEKADEALATISQNPDLLPVEMVHPRYIYLIAFIIRKQWDLAKTELRNLKRMLNQPNSPFLEVEHNIASHYQTYLRFHELKPALRISETAKLKTAATETFGQHAGLTYSNIHLAWLIFQLG